MNEDRILVLMKMIQKMKKDLDFIDSELQSLLPNDNTIENMSPKKKREMELRAKIIESYHKRK
ncbi:hypothetical protein ABE425_14550 [Chryseobacterium cucumeris]|uniref:hypothetical protein n=1 Tax=Chryseobacterium cucumeris TaxID=1813611 RepID=UPI00320B5BE0